MNTDAANYSITITAADTNPNSADTITNFILIVEPNRIPEVYLGLTAPVNPTVYFPFSYTIPVNAFRDHENDPITIIPEIIPANFGTIYDSITRVFSFTPSDNSKIGAYTLKVTAKDSWEVGSTIAAINFSVLENKAPIVVTTVNNPPCIVAHYPLNYNVPKSNFAEPEGETILYSFTSSVPTPWLSLDITDPNNLKFSGVPNNTQVGNVTITLILDDGHNDVANTTTTFKV